MKNTLKITILLIVGGLSTKLNAQNYFPFIKENARWECYFTNPYEHIDKMYFFNGTEKINDTIYYKAYYQLNDSPDSIFFGLLREENKMVYIRYGVKDYIFCNFDLKVNDTLGYNYVVESIDSIYLFQSYRRRWIVNYFDKEINQNSKTYIVEGIGSTSSFDHFFYPQCHPSDYYCDMLSNYYEGDLTISNSILMKTESVKYEHIIDFEYSNPVDEIFTLKFKSIENAEILVEIISIDGKIISNQMIQNNTNIYQTNVSYLQKGLYLCRVKNKETIKTFKFIKN